MELNGGLPIQCVVSVRWKEVALDLYNTLETHHKNLSQQCASYMIYCWIYYKGF